VVYDDAQAGERLCDADGFGELVGPDEQVNAQIAVCEEGYVALPVGVVEGQAAIPSAGPDAAESSVGREADQLVSEPRSTGFEVADEP
jgi:hypothetical protein